MSTEAPQAFQDLPISKPILKALKALNYDKPTDVQGGIIPLVLAGIDLIVQSQTGTGKTAAFGIPIAEMLDSQPGTVQALVLAPTRELANQVAGELRRVGCDACDLDVLAVFGGASIQNQIRGLETAQVICATPGRMLDLLRRNATHLDNLKVFVLDEADEMLSMGFEKELDAIREYLPEERQTLLFSATVGEDIKGVAAKTLFYPEFVTFSSDSLGAQEVKHEYFLISGVGRLRDLHRLLMLDEPSGAIIFCNTKDTSFRVANFLKSQGYNADVLNGDLPQAERQKVMGRMKAGDLQFLVATDIAARGIDISFLPCVINYILPESAESYVHRTGRTGRAGRSGVAVSLISPKEIGMFYQLRRAYHFELTSRDLPADEELFALKERRALDRILDGLDAEEELQYGEYLGFAESFPKLPDYRQRLAKLMAYFVEGEAAKVAQTTTTPRATAGVAERHSRVTAPVEPPAAALEASSRLEVDADVADTTAMDPMVAVPTTALETAEPPAAAAGDTEKPRRKRKRSRRRRSEGGANGDDRVSAADQEQTGEHAGVVAASNMTRIRVNLGSDRIDPAGLVELIADLSGMDLSDLGTAELQEDYSWVEVRSDLADDVIAAIAHERIDDHELAASR